MVENGAKHLLGSTELLYLPKSIGRRGMKSFEGKYKITKIKAVAHLYANPDPTMGLLREFEEKAARTGRRSLVKDAQRYAEICRNEAGPTTPKTNWPQKRR